MRRLLHDAGVIVAVTIIYFAAGKLGLRLAFVHKSATILWPPSGIALAVLLVLGRRAVAGIFAGALLVNLTTEGGALASLAIAAGNTLEALAGAWLVGRLAGGANAFLRVRNVFLFAALAGAAATTISPTIGLTSLVLAGYGDWASYGVVWRTWWLGDAMGVLILAPALVLWSVRRPSPLRLRYAARAALILGLVVAVSVLALGRRSELGFLCPLLVVWTAFGLDARETLTAVVLVTGVAIWRTLDGLGPFAGGSPNDSLLFLQTFIAVNAITGLGIGAVLRQRATAREDLERQVSERTASLVERNRELGRLEVELRQAKDAAERASAAKGELLATMSHEIRTPLHAIVAVGDLLAEGELDAERRLHAERLQRASRRLLELLNDVLELERVEAGQLALAPADYDLRGLLGEIGELFEASAGARGLALRFEIDGEVPRRGFGDAGRLRQVLANLVSNAIKFTEHGAVVVRAAMDDAVTLHLSVADTGIGIPVEQQARIFERFVQSAGRSDEGSGLGLAIAAKLVALMGGRLWVESEPGAGSTFHAVLPLRVTRALRILHVDDAEESRAILAAYLAGSVHRIDGVADGDAALARLRAERYDLVLMDLWMAGEKGHEVTRRVRAREASEGAAPVRIVAFSADGSAEARRLAGEAGASGFLAKPIGRAAFLRFLDDEPATGPDPEMAALVDRYRRARRGDVEAMRAALRAGELGVIAQLGHSMKGSGGAYGFAEITRLGGLLCDAAERGDAAVITTTIADLEAVLAERAIT